MVHDSLDLFTPRGRFTATGIFYADRPEVNAGGVRFNYEYVSPYSATYKRLFANIQGSTGDTVIRTNDMINPVENQSWILLADGRLFCVEQVEIDYQSAPKQSFRFFGTPIGTTYVLRLCVKENAWDVK